MHLSISNFKQRDLKSAWLSMFATATLIFLAFACAMEIDLAQLGYQPTAQDSPERWAKERARVSQLGSRALILTGNSRFQLGLDLDKLRNETNLEPVQLAIDGSSFFPVLKSLADDPRVTGTILVDYSSGTLESAGLDKYDHLEVFERAFIREQKPRPFDFSLAEMEIKLTEIVHENLRSYADGATPLMSLLTRVIPQTKAEQYLITRADRSRVADYHNSSIHQIYYRRVARTLGMNDAIDVTAPNAEEMLRSRIEAVRPHSTPNFIAGMRSLLKLKATIEARGGRVIFVEMPTSGMVREIEEKRFPREAFWDVFAAEVKGSALASSADPKLKLFSCPDGSHLDKQDRAKFSESLVHSLGIGKRN